MASDVTDEGARLVALPAILKKAEIAAFLRVNVRSVDVYIADGRLEAYEIGPKQWRVTREAFERFLERSRRGGSAA